MTSKCAYVSERAGIACQLTAAWHREWRCHMAWDENGVPILKAVGEFVYLSQDVGAP